MGELSKIQWTDHTFNPWWGCTKVSAGCENCYAEAAAKRYGHQVWGPKAPRRFFGPGHWAEPLKWNAAAARGGARARVFCASMADVFEDHGVELVNERARLWALVENTPHLDWLLLTKRPEKLTRMLPAAWLEAPRPNVWLGTTVEDQRRAEERVKALLETPAAVRFLSCEPLLGPVDLAGIVEQRFPDHPSGIPAHVEFDGLRGFSGYAVDGSADRRGVDWVIVGGESGANSRPFDLRWARSLVDQCRDAGVAVFVKQLGAVPVVPVEELPVARAARTVGERAKRAPAGTGLLHLLSPKGDDPASWPADLRVRQFPEVRA